MTDLTPRSIRANGLELSYFERGKGPLFLLLHGFPDCPYSFRQQLESLSQAGYRVVAPWMRGYTPGAIPERGSYQPAAFGQDVLALIEALGHDDAVVYGHDWGSTAACAAALIAPGKIRRLVLGSLPYGPGLPTALVTNGRQQRRSWYVFFFQTALADIAVPLDDFAFIEALWRDWSPGFTPPPDVMAAVKKTLAEPGVLPAALAYYRTALDPGRRDPDLEPIERRFGVDPIEVPTLYVHGAEDGCIGTEVSEGMEPLFPAGLRRVVIDGAGHFVHLEAPEVFHRAVLR